jgi:ABC-type microcin C transport system permease subunit YejB
MLIRAPGSIWTHVRLLTGAFMGAYILRRLLLMIPTIFGIMAVSFLVVQFAPGGPVEEVISDGDRCQQYRSGRPDRRQRHQPQQHLGLSRRPRPDA